MSRSPILVEPRGNTLVAADAYAAEQIAELKPGQYNARLSRITATGREQREGLRGLYWAGMGLLAENTDDPWFNDKRKASDNTLVAIGYTRPRFRVDGSFEFIPVSLADDAMPDEEFEIVLEKARAFLTEKFGFDPMQAWLDEKDAVKGGAR